MNTKLKIIFRYVFVLVIFSLSVRALAVWVYPSDLPPPNNPPNNNIAQPINVGNQDQEKSGGLAVGGLLTPQIRITDGNQALDSVLASDALGFGNWKTLAELGVGSGGGDGDVNAGGTDNAGTPNYVTKWVGAPGTTTIDDSQIFDNGINVGVGTASPATKLDIAGTAKMTGFQLGNSTTAGYVLTANAQGVGTWQASGSGGDGDLPLGSLNQTLRHTGTGWLANSFLFNNLSKIGIGTSSPTQQLEITQNLKLPNTNSGGTAGVIFIGNDRFIHNRGVGNTFVGKDSGNFSLSGQGNTGVGENTLKVLNSGGDNSALGYNALLSNTSGANNVAVGKDALKSNTTTGNNTATGYQALLNNVGEYNSALGAGALSGNTSGDNNTAIGVNALNTNTGGSNNTVLGYNADVNSGSLSNATAIGANAVVNVSNTMVFGDNTIVGWGFGAQPGSDAIKVGGPGTAGNGATLTQEGQWVGGSDRTLKHNIKNILYGLDEVLLLRPVEFNWNINNRKDIGFIAQEVQEIIPEVVHGEEGGMTMSYGQLTALLTKAIQELNEENEMLEDRIEALKQKLED